MAQRIITADSVIPVADTTTIAALRTTMAAGSVITANNINTLATFSFEKYSLRNAIAVSEGIVVKPEAII